MSQQRCATPGEAGDLQRRVTTGRQRCQRRIIDPDGDRLRHERLMGHHDDMFVP